MANNSNLKYSESEKEISVKKHFKTKYGILFKLSNNVI